MDSLFAQAPVPLWVADFTAAAALLAHVSDDGHDAILAALRADPDLLAACGQAVRVVTANAAAAALMGFENGDTMHGPLGTMLPDTAMDALAGQIAAVLGGRTPFREEAIEVDQPDRRIVIELHLSLPDPSDWSRAIVATIDRTDHVKTEDRLRASEDRFRAICEHAPVMIDQFDADGKCVLWNHECERRLGWTLEEVRAHADPLTLFYPDEAERLRVIAAIQERDGAFREYSVLAKDGQSRTQMWADLRLPSGEQISVGYDTTEQRELEEQARQKQKLESLGLMAGGVAHDFNNLLVGVLANADLARMRRRHDTELCEMLDEVVDAAQRAAGLSRQLLAYSGGAAFTAVPIDLSALIEELAPMIAASAPSHATVRYDLEPDLSSVEGDPTQLTQVVFNLVLNACEALGEGADGVSVSTFREGARLCLEVVDDGVGMDETTRSRMFDPFFTTKFTGRGLGLASVLGIVRGHDGSIEVDSALGRGTTTRVWLPASGAPPAPSTDDALSSRTRGGLVLLVDDEPSVRETTGRLLQALGYETRAYPGGAPALAWFRQHAADVRLALVDVTMPGMSGPELLVALRSVRKDLPALLVSGYTPDAFEGLEPTTTKFLEKPFTMSTLSAEVDALLGDCGTPRLPIDRR